VGRAASAKRQRRDSWSRRIAFVIGAGASAGAGSIVPTTPPLGRELYGRLVREYPNSWGKLAPKLEAVFETDFETGTAMLWEDEPIADSVTPAELLIEMAIYFSRFAPTDEENCYARLIAILQRRRLVGRTAFLSLNYECLLELAATSRGLRISYLVEGLPSRNNVLVLKPHGSCNFIPQVEIYTMRLVVGKGGIFDGPITIPRNLSEVAARYARGYAVPPAMSLFAPGKRTVVAPRIIEQIRQRWSDWARGARATIVIGARPLLADNHVWDPVLESTGPVWYIGGSTGADYENLRRALDSRFVHVGDRFEGALGRLDAMLGDI
jgi:hypothetical protein